MEILEIGINLIQDFEGCKLVAYQDSKSIWTIATGNIRINNRAVRKGDVVTQAVADQMLKDTLKLFVDGVNKALGKQVVNANQFSAMVCLSYNIGLGAFSGSTLLKKVLLNPDDPAIKDEFVKWRDKGQAHEKGLLRRRLSESNLYFTGTIKTEWDAEIKKIMG